MASMVCFHAHPDDESILTAGVMAMAAAAGRRVVLVVATKGEVGEVADGFLAPGESLADRRVVETMNAATALGASRVEFLGYLDSGMADTPTNSVDGAFARADVEEAASRLAAILTEEEAEVITIYDENGGYGHPDHIQVHRVGRRAAELAGTPRVYEATWNREAVVRGTAELVERFGDNDAVRQVAAEFSSLDDAAGFGIPESEITTVVDVSDYVEQKRAAMTAHESQISADSWFLQLPPEAFRLTFSTEWFIRVGAEPGVRETSLFPADAGSSG
jgi:LmbE family N-acetylglucosaminyl deacetylase